MIARLILIIAIALPLEAFAQDLKVLSWNTFMLPWPIKNSNQKIRTKVIADALQGQGYDFIFMQEAFIGAFRKHVGKQLKSEYPHQYYLGNNKFVYPLLGSGVFLLGKYPFKVVDKVYYNKCAAADCWASKGSVLVETNLPTGKTVQFAITHLQAKESLGAIRLSQLQQVKGMLKKHKREGVPQLFIGDMNIDVKEEEFESALDLMGMKHTELVGPVNHTNVIDCYKKPTHEKEWIDHMWVSDDTDLKDSSISVREVTYTHKGRTCMAADHHAIHGEFTFAD